MKHGANKCDLLGRGGRWGWGLLAVLNSVHPALSLSYVHVLLPFKKKELKITRQHYPGKST